jgi:hypothetical protein
MKLFERAYERVSKPSKRTSILRKNEMEEDAELKGPLHFPLDLSPMDRLDTAHGKS